MPCRRKVPLVVNHPLSAPPGRQRETVAAAAFKWGFNDLRTFNRAFSARDGMTARWFAR
jgi:AraC-like DNA-binding protein